MSSAVLCEYLPWDSDLFGYRIGRVAPHRLDAASMDQALAWCRQERIDCLYLLSDSDASDTVRLAEDHRFRLVDIRLTLECALETASSSTTNGVTIRPCCAADLPASRQIARQSHRDGRFYHDAQFSESLADRFYETWIEASVQGFAQAVFVADIDGQAVGYVSCHRDEGGPGRIGLLGVSASCRGRGVGKALVQHAQRWCAAQGAREMSVVTQGRNRAAQRLYQRCGFTTSRMQLWYHRWFTR